MAGRGDQRAVLVTKEVAPPHSPRDLQHNFLIFGYWFLRKNSAYSPLDYSKRGAGQEAIWERPSFSRRGPPSELGEEVKQHHGEHSKVSNKLSIDQKCLGN